MNRVGIGVSGPDKVNGLLKNSHSKKTAAAVALQFVGPSGDSDLPIGAQAFHEVVSEENCDAEQSARTFEAGWCLFFANVDSLTSRGFFREYFTLD